MMGLQGMLPRNSAMAAGMAPAAWAPAAAPAAARVQIVNDKPVPRQYEYGGDLVRGTQQATQAYIQQVRAHALLFFQNFLDSHPEPDRGRPT